MSNRSRPEEMPGGDIIDEIIHDGDSKLLRSTLEKTESSAESRRGIPNSYSAFRKKGETASALNQQPLEQNENGKH